MMVCSTMPRDEAQNQLSYIASDTIFIIASNVWNSTNPMPLLEAIPDGHL
jgi:hypothetical protein